MDKTSLGDRMKGYEAVSKSKLLRRTPTIIRLDGKAFHTWTKQLRSIDESLDIEPYSIIMHRLMRKTTKYLMDNIQNAVFAYSQSDEISILMNDWKRLTTDSWFNSDIQKIASVSASMATCAFNNEVVSVNNNALCNTGLTSALFDSRVFNVPKEEVTNYFVWRQQDATRNSINMLGQFYFSHKKLQGKNVSQVQDMLMEKYQINWNDCDIWKKRGFCVTEKYGYDRFIPIFTKDRNFIEEYLAEEEE
jgi:tRNA(His) 5'-end guanylyltransferase